MYCQIIDTINLVKFELWELSLDNHQLVRSVSCINADYSWKETVISCADLRFPESARTNQFGECLAQLVFVCLP